MKQLSGLDTAFLSMETATTFAHVSTLSVYRPPLDPLTPPFELFRSQLEARLGLLEPLRRRLAEVPFNLDRPWWIEDPDFDLEFHVRHVAVPAPGGDREVADLVAQIIGRPLDRSRPLWEAYVVEGLQGDRWAVLLKVHHAAIDGAGGAALQALLLDEKPMEQLPELASPPAAEKLPSEAELLTRSVWNYTLHPQRLAAAHARLLRETASLLDKGWTRRWKAASPAWRAKELVELSTVPSPAPPTPFNRGITPHRRLAFCSVRLADVRAIKTASGVTVNDVVLTACAGALRRYLERHDALVDRPLVAAVPVSIRTGNEEDPWTNRVSAITVPLATHLDDPRERLAFTADATSRAKGAFELVPTEALAEFSQFLPPALLSQAAATMTRLRVADAMHPVTNLVISNVPGPRRPLYLGTARLEHYYPISTVAEGQGLNITVQSYEDKLDIGLVACRELVPDLWDLLELVTDEIDLLLSCTGTPSAEDSPATETADRFNPDQSIPNPPDTEQGTIVNDHTPPSGLDPQAKLIIDLTERALAGGAPPMWEMTPSEARDTYRKMNLMLGGGEAVDSVEDRLIPGSGGELAIRVYRPGPGTRPAFVYYHGGGFVIGDLDTHDRENRRIANQSGAVVISVDYRLAPEHPFPAATDDAWSSLLWVKEHAPELDIDPQRLAVGGDSAGGNLAAVTAQRARVEGVDLALQVLIYPAVDIAEGVDERYPSRTLNDGLVLSRQVNEWFLGAYIGQGPAPDDRRLRPIAGDLAGVAPALVITAQFDPLRDEGRQYAERLRSAGVTTTHTDYAGQIHGFFNLGPAIAAGWTAVDEVAAALRTHLGDAVPPQP